MSSELKQLRVKVLADMYSVIRVDSERWNEIVADPSLSPRMSAPFMIFRSEQDFVLMLDEADSMGIKARFPKGDIQAGLRILEVRSSDGHRSPSAFSGLSSMVAEAGFGIRVLSGWDADFAVINQDELGAVLKFLSPHIEELC
jgi:hypothetical protein